MSLNLDPRQRAMLLEMGVHVWLPEAPVAELPPVRESLAVQAESAQAAGFRAPTPLASVPVLPLSPVFRPVSEQEAPPPARPLDGVSAVWLLGAAQPLYAKTAATQPSAETAQSAQTSGGARWLVLAETPPTALPGGVLSAFSAFDGDAGQLLDNMLRAARLNGAALALLAPLVRQGAGAVTPEFSAALAALVAQTQPDIVLIMGRLASQSLLPIGQPFGKLRGQVHALHGARAIVTYDAPYLLRTPGDKAKAWADLCLAMSLTAAP